MKKYELMQDDTIQISGETLYRIRALRDFWGVRAGEIGGYIAKEKTSHTPAMLGSPAMPRSPAIPGSPAMLGSPAGNGSLHRSTYRGQDIHSISVLRKRFGAAAKITPGGSGTMLTKRLRINTTPLILCGNMSSISTWPVNCMAMRTA